jgi:hypothetical protein
VAVHRFLRPVSFQSVPDRFLPAALRDANPLGVPLRVDGRAGDRRTVEIVRYANPGDKTIHVGVLTDGQVTPLPVPDLADPWSRPRAAGKDALAWLQRSVTDPFARVPARPIRNRNGGT